MGKAPNSKALSKLFLCGIMNSNKVFCLLNRLFDGEFYFFVFAVDIVARF